MNEITLGRAMYACGECKLFDNDTFPWHRYPKGHIVYVFTCLNGNTYTVGDTTIHLSSDFLPCDKHKAEIEANQS